MLVRIGDDGCQCCAGRCCLHHPASGQNRRWNVTFVSRCPLLKARIPYAPCAPLKWMGGTFINDAAIFCVVAAIA
ncbi:hypothetical protein KCP73_14575 [Salmonella enterica subsp. enterica]|nr:hypothetical protein KCP73_14575 [Salmonella enterica subsp. enterica]